MSDYAPFRLADLLEKVAELERRVKELERVSPVRAGHWVRHDPLKDNPQSGLYDPGDPDYGR